MNTQMHERVILTADRRILFRQVGWLGFTGAFYPLHEDPSRTERGGFSPLWVEVENEPRLDLADAEVAL